MTNSIEDLRDIYRVFDQQMSAVLRVSGATSADDVVDALPARGSSETPTLSALAKMCLVCFSAK